MGKKFSEGTAKVTADFTDPTTVYLMGVDTSGTPASFRTRAFDVVRTGLTVAWSGTGTATTPLLVNVTADPGGGANVASKLFDAQMAGTSRFNITKEGITHINATPVAGTGEVLKLTSSYGTASVRVVGGGGLVIGGVLSALGAVSVALDGSPLSFGTSGDLALIRDAADTLAQRRSSNPQLLRLYELYVGGSDYSRAVFGFRDSAGNTMGSPALRIGTEHAGSGVARAVSIVTGGTERVSISATSGKISATGDLDFPASVTSMGSQGIARYGSSTFVSGNSSAIAVNTGNLIAQSTAKIGFSGGSITSGSLATANTTLDAAIERPAANIIGITNGSTGPGKLAIDNVQGANLERLKMEWNTNVARIGTEKAGSGTARDLAFITDDTVRMVIYGGGGINTGGNEITAYKLQQTSSRLEIQAPETIPASATAGNAGSICYDSDYIYVAVSSGSWKRVALSAF